MVFLELINLPLFFVHFGAISARPSGQIVTPYGDFGICGFDSLVLRSLQSQKLNNTTTCLLSFLAVLGLFVVPLLAQGGSLGALGRLLGQLWVSLVRLWGAWGLPRGLLKG